MYSTWINYTYYDVETAFLNAELDDDIWLKIPKGTRLVAGDDEIYKLVKSLYGLKKASRCWNNLTKLIEKEFKRMDADPCIYIKEFQVDEKGVHRTQYQKVALYVCDLIIAASTRNLLTALEGVLESRLKMKKFNQIKQTLGMCVHHDIEKSVKQFNKCGVSAFRTPMDDRAHYSKSQMPKAGSVEALQAATSKYRELVGTLLWISNGICPYIVFAVNTLAKFTCNPGLVHWRSSLRVHGYLYATRTYYIWYAQQHFNGSMGRAAT
jgi:Reverse transcriptase (RNA-dependent DNA polymerase)